MTKTGIQTLALAAVLSVIGTLPAEAQTYTVLHNFAGQPGDGANPGFGRVLGDSGGNLYGTATAAELSALERCSSWIRAARRPFFTASEDR